MIEEVNDPIEVVTIFRKNELIPWKFLWQGKEYVIKKINLSYSSWEGRNKIYFFAVSDQSNYFKLKFDSNNLSWVLMESYVD